MNGVAMLDDAVAVIGPPAVGKTALTLLLGQLPGRQVFRLREYVPETILAATATSAEQLGWIDDLTVTMALRAYLDSVVTDCTVHTVLLDNFPGSAQQVRLFLSIIRKLAPTCAIHPVELVADPATLNRRTRERRVCHQCERDPIHDPRLPAVANPANRQRCARCNNVLHPRRGDAPRIFAARMERYRQSADGIREAFASAGVPVLQLESSGPPEQIANELITLLKQ